MKYPFNKPPVIRRPLGTAADILLHSYTHPLPPLPFSPGGCSCGRECKEDVRGREDPLLPLFPYPRAFLFVR